MKVSAIRSGVSFGAAIKPSEIEEFKKVRDEAKALVGQNGKSIFIVHDACLPQSVHKNTGVANLASRESLDFLKYMQTYTGCNMIEVLPQGQVGNAKGSGLYCAYAGTAFSLGNHQINPALLTTERYGKLLTKEEFSDIVKANDKADAHTIANYENVMSPVGEQSKKLKIAFDRFKILDENNELKQRYNTYVAENEEWLKIPISYEPDKEFYQFKQFLADSHLKDAKTEINNLGMKLCGDCLINFSEDERRAFPKAFLQNEFIGTPDWQITSLDYDKLSDPTSDAAKLLKMKVQLFAKRYDAIRFDVGWSYLNPLIHKTDGTSYGNDLGDNVLKFIENAVKEVKGEDFDLKDLMYEFEGGREFKPNSGELHDAAKTRTKIYSSTYMHDNNFDVWGSNDAFLKRGWDPEYFVIGPGNHDPQPLKQIALDMPDTSVLDGQKYHKADAVDALSKIFRVDAETLKEPAEFAKMKWAEPMTARHNQMFYMDVLGRQERFDMQNLNLVNDESKGLFAYKNYARKITEDYKCEYHKAVEDGFGFNIMDSLERVFRLKGLEQSHPELYSKIVKFRDVLLAPTDKLSMATDALSDNSTNNSQTIKTLLDDNFESVDINTQINEIVEPLGKKKIKTSVKGIGFLAGALLIGGAIYCGVKDFCSKSLKLGDKNSTILKDDVKSQAATSNSTQQLNRQVSMKNFLA